MGRLVRRFQVLTLAFTAACSAPPGGARVTADDVRAVDSLLSAYTGDTVPGASVVVIERPPERPEWRAIRDRLARAAR